MKREKLETYIGRQVKVLLFDGRAYEGCLQKTNTDAVKHNPKPYSYHAFQILYWCGLRVGELLALTPQDIDFDNKLI